MHVFKETVVKWLHEVCSQFSLLFLIFLPWLVIRILSCRLCNLPDISITKYFFPYGNFSFIPLFNYIFDVASSLLCRFERHVCLFRSLSIILKHSRNFRALLRWPENELAHSYQLDLNCFRVGDITKFLLMLTWQIHLEVGFAWALKLLLYPGSSHLTLLIGSWKLGLEVKQLLRKSGPGTAFPSCPSGFFFFFFSPHQMVMTWCYSRTWCT